MLPGDPFRVRHPAELATDLLRQEGEPAPHPEELEGWRMETMFRGDVAAVAALPAEEIAWAALGERGLSEWEPSPVPWSSSEGRNVISAARVTYRLVAPRYPDLVRDVELLAKFFEGS